FVLIPGPDPNRNGLTKAETTVELKLVVGKHLLDTVRGGVRLRSIGRRHDEDELLTAAPNEHVDAANGLANAIREHSEHDIPDRMAEAVVQGLEVVEVHVQKAEVTA